MSTSRILLALCLSLSPLACTSTVVGGGGTGAGGTVTGYNTPDDGSQLPPPLTPASAIAILASQIDWNAGAGGGGTSSSSSSGGGVDPNMLYVMVGSPVPSCAAPFASTGACGPSFAISIGIPPQLQQPGTLLLSSPGLISTFGEMGPPNSPTPGDCPGGGGSFGDGTIDIVSMDANQVVFTLGGTMLFAGEGIPDGVADGTYTAARCP